MIQITWIIAAKTLVNGYTEVLSFMCIAGGSKLRAAQTVWFVLKMMKIMVLI